MEDVITWILIIIMGFVVVGLFLFFTIYAWVFVLNLFYHLFTGKNLKIYEKISSIFEDREGPCLIPFWFLKF